MLNSEKTWAIIGAVAGVIGVVLVVVYDRVNKKRNSKNECDNFTTQILVPLEATFKIQDLETLIDALFNKKSNDSKTGIKNFSKYKAYVCKIENFCLKIDKKEINPNVFSERCGSYIKRILKYLVQFIIVNGYNPNNEECPVKSIIKVLFNELYKEECKEIILNYFNKMNKLIGTTNPNDIAKGKKYYMYYNKTKKYYLIDEQWYQNNFDENKLSVFK